MISLREASPEDAAAMARIQSESLRENGEEYYTDEQLAHLAPAEPHAEEIPEDEFTDDSCRPIIAELDGEIVGWGSIHLNENVLAATFPPVYRRALSVVRTGNNRTGCPSITLTSQTIELKRHGSTRQCREMQLNTEFHQKSWCRFSFNKL